jgi:hypothetical protein
MYARLWWSTLVGRTLMLGWRSGVERGRELLATVSTGARNQLL